MKIETLSAYWPLLLGILLGGLIGAALGYFGQCSSGACPLTANPWRGAMFGALLGLLFALSSRTSPTKPSESEPRSENSRSAGTGRTTAIPPLNDTSI